MEFKIIIILAAIFGFYQLIFVADKNSKLILFSQIISVALILLPFEKLQQIGILLFSTSALFTLIYSIFNPTFSNQKKIYVNIIVLPVLLLNLFILFKLPYATYFSFAMVLPLVCFTIIITTRFNTYTYQIGFLTIFTADALAKFLIAIKYWQ